MLLRPSMITLSLCHSASVSHKACLIFLEHFRHIATSGPLHWMFSLLGTTFHQFSEWLALWPASSLCSTTTFTVKPTYPARFIYKFSTHHQNSSSPFHTLFSRTHLSLSNIHCMFPYFGYCLILFHCQNVNSMRVRSFVCLVHYYDPGACNSTWHVVGTQ